jgi:hypothetical protein
MGKVNGIKINLTTYCPMKINPLNAKLNPICHLLPSLGAHHIPHFNRIRVNGRKTKE